MVLCELRDHGNTLSNEFQSGNDDHAAVHGLYYGCVKGNTV